MRLAWRCRNQRCRVLPLPNRARLLRRVGGAFAVAAKGAPLPAIVKQHPSDWQITGFQRRKAGPMAALPRAAAAGRALLPRRPEDGSKSRHNLGNPGNVGICAAGRDRSRAQHAQRLSAHQPFLEKKRPGGNRAFWLWLPLHRRRERWTVLDQTCIACQRSQPGEPPRGGLAHRRAGDGP